ncbi:MAG: ATP-binding protein, partial [Bacteriovoracaceae bacterium]
IDAVKCDVDPWIKIVAEEVDNKVTITVIDSGPGIDESIKPKLMTPFFTTKDVGEGVGLGLPISKGLMENNNGKLVYVDDFPNTAFRIIFN